MRWREILSRHVDIWRSAWVEQRRLAPAAALKGREVEFLPAVLEIQDAPPSPVGRAIGGTVIAVFLAGIAWACLGYIDIVAVAPGKIIPSGYSKVIQPLEAGVIRAIHVKDGQVVKQGEVLIELDPTVNTAEGARLSNEYWSAVVQAARLRALIAGRSALNAPPHADPKFVAVQQHMLRSQLAEHQSRVAAAQHVINQRKAALAATLTSIAYLGETVPILTERAVSFKKLLTDEYASRMEYLAAEKQRVDEVKELARLTDVSVQDRAALAEAEQNYQVLVSEFQKSRHDELNEQEMKAASLFQQRVQVTQRTGLQQLTASIDGKVQQLAVHTLGGVVTPAQQLLLIVPKEHHVEAEVMVENKDIGFVQEGQLVEMKIETFPFTRYGLIDGRIVNVSNDAVQVDKSGQVVPSTSSQQGGALVYPARVSLATSVIQVEGKPVTLAPGMAVTAEIKTGQRRLIEFFLSPLLKATQETARER